MSPDIVKCPWGEGNKITLVVKDHYSSSIQLLSTYCIHDRHFAYITLCNLNGILPGGGEFFLFTRLQDHGGGEARIRGDEG